MITKVEHIEKRCLRVFFNDGEVRKIDLHEFFQTKNPFVQKYKPMDKFMSYYINNGVLCWGDNELDINPTNIYNGNFNINKIKN